MLDSMLSTESCSSSSRDSYGSEPIFSSPPPIPNLHISIELPYMSEVLKTEAAPQEGHVQMKAHVASPEG
jgi:hypothetical protein